MKSMGWFAVGMVVSLFFWVSDVFAASVVKVDFDTQGRLLKQRKHRGFYLTR